MSNVVHNNLIGSRPKGLNHDPCFYGGFMKYLFLGLLCALQMACSPQTTKDQQIDQASSVTSYTALKGYYICQDGNEFDLTILESIDQTVLVDWNNCLNNVTFTGDGSAGVMHFDDVKHCVGHPFNLSYAINNGALILWDGVRYESCTKY